MQITLHHAGIRLLSLYDITRLPLVRENSTILPKTTFTTKKTIGFRMVPRHRRRGISAIRQKTFVLIGDIEALRAGLGERGYLVIAQIDPSHEQVLPTQIYHRSKQDRQLRQREFQCARKPCVLVIETCLPSGSHPIANIDR